MPGRGPECAPATCAPATCARRAGLDSTSAKRVVDILAALSCSGVTIALSIHQPRLDIFQMLTHLLLLSGTGRMVFSGPARLAAAHFTALGHPPPPAVNTADFILDVVIRLSPSQVQACPRVPPTPAVSPCHIAVPPLHHESLLSVPTARSLHSARVPLPQPPRRWHTPQARPWHAGMRS